MLLLAQVAKLCARKYQDQTGQASCKVDDLSEGIHKFSLPGSDSLYDCDFCEQGYTMSVNDVTRAWRVSLVGTENLTLRCPILLLVQLVSLTYQT